MVEDDPSPKPSTESLNVFLLFTTRHACNVEYFLNKLELGSKDPERPHDLVGPGNKFEYSVLMGLALVYEERKEEVVNSKQSNDDTQPTLQNEEIITEEVAIPARLNVLLGAIIVMQTSEISCDMVAAIVWLYGGKTRSL